MAAPEERLSQAGASRSIHAGHTLLPSPIRDLPFIDARGPFGAALLSRFCSASDDLLAGGATSPLGVSLLSRYRCFPPPSFLLLLTRLSLSSAPLGAFFSSEQAQAQLHSVQVTPPLPSPPLPCTALSLALPTSGHLDTPPIACMLVLRTESRAALSVASTHCFPQREASHTTARHLLPLPALAPQLRPLMPCPFPSIPPAHRDTRSFGLPHTTLDQPKSSLSPRMPVLLSPQF
jgi:hypothetical protein